MTQLQDDSSRNRRTVKRILAIGLPFVVLAGAGVGYAYWSGGGTGSASSSAATSVSNLVLTPKTAVTGLVPGDSVTVPVTATNNNATTSVSLSTLATGAITSGSAACDLLLATAGTKVTAAPVQPAVTPVVVAPAGGAADFGSVTVSMENSATVNQDACKGKTFTVALTAS